MSLLIIDDFHESLLTGLNKLNITYDYLPSIAPEEVMQLNNAYQGLLLRSKLKIDAPFIAHFNKIKLIARGGAGLDGINEAACLEKGIHLINAPEGNRDAVAEQTVGMILAWHHKIVWAHQSVQKGEWLREDHRGLEIKNKTIGILGFGNTGKEVAKRFASFGCNIICHDIDETQYDESLAKAVSLEELQESSDIITIHIPLLKRNHHLVNSHFISKIKSSSLLVNMSRGSILDTPNVLALLAQNEFAGLCTDVIEGEQKDGFPKLDMQSKTRLPELRDRIIMTPHIGGWTHESYQRIAEVILQKITPYLEMSDNEKKSTH